MRSLKHINAYLCLDGKNVTKGAVEKFLGVLQSDIKSGKITKAKDKFTKEVDRIQRSLVGMSNAMWPGEDCKVEIEPARKKHYEGIIKEQGLGFLPIMIGGAISKLCEHHIVKYFSKDKTALSGVSKPKLLASSPTEAGILSIINKYFYSTTFKLVDGKLYNSKGPVNNFTVDQKKGRYRFLETGGSIAGLKTDEKALRKYVKNKNERLTHGYKLAKRKKVKTVSKKKRLKKVVTVKKVTPKKKKVTTKKTVVKKLPTAKIISLPKKVEEKKKALKKVSFIFKNTPETFEEAVLLYFLKNGKISTADFKRYTGFGVKNERTGKTHGSKEFKSYIWAYKTKAMSIDNLVHALWTEDMNMPESSLDEQDRINEFFEILTSHSGKRSMMNSVIEIQMDAAKNKNASPEMLREAEDAAEAEKFFNTSPLTTKEITDFIAENDYRNEFEKKYEMLAGTKKVKKELRKFKSAKPNENLGTISNTVNEVLANMRKTGPGSSRINKNTHALPSSNEKMVVNVVEKEEIKPMNNNTNSNPVVHSVSQTEGTISGTEMGNMTFEKLNFNDYYKGIFGSPATNFDMCIDGAPGSGKTVFLLKFANYLADYHGPTLFVTTEEFGSSTLIDKVNRFNIKSKNLHFAKKVPAAENLSKYKFIFIDSINHAKITIEQYQAMRDKAGKAAFILVLQQTKGGSYKGSTDWPHEVEMTMSLFKNEFDERMLKISKDRYTDPVPRTVAI